VPVISRLEAALSLAMAVFFVCKAVDWDTGADVAAVPFVALLVLFAARIIFRKSRGKTWDEAWGRRPADHS